MVIAELFGSYGRMILSGIIATLLGAASYFAMLKFDKAGALGELLPLIVVPAVLLSVGVVGFFVNWISRVPYSQWENLEGRVADLEHRLKPVISVRTATNHRADPIAYGTTRVSLGGTRQTVIAHGPDHTLRLDITNDSATLISGCEAYLVRFERVDEETEPTSWHSLRLPWLQAGAVDDGGTDIPPSGIRSIALFRVINNRVHLVRDDGVPVHMVNAIKDRGEYSGLVAVTSRNAPTAHVAFTLACYGPDAAPLLNVERGSPFDDDDGLFWARSEGL
jgi:hypothetical protein